MKEYRAICFYGNWHLKEIITFAASEEAAEQELKKLVLEQGIKESSILHLSASTLF